MACSTIDLQKYIDSDSRTCIRRISVKPVTFPEAIDITKYVENGWSWGSNSNEPITTFDFCLPAQITPDECDNSLLQSFADDDGFIYTYPLKVENPELRLISHNTEICIEKKLGYVDCETGQEVIEADYSTEWQGFISDISEKGDKEVCVSAVDKLKILQNKILPEGTYNQLFPEDVLGQMMIDAIGSSRCEWSSIYNPYTVLAIPPRIDVTTFEECKNLFEAMQEAASTIIGGQVRMIQDPTGTCVPECEFRVGLYIEGRYLPDRPLIKLRGCHGKIKTGCTDTDIVTKVEVHYHDADTGQEEIHEYSNDDAALWLGGDAGIDGNGNPIPRVEGIICAKVEFDEDSTINNIGSASQFAIDYINRASLIRGQVQIILDFPLPCIDVGYEIDLCEADAFSGEVALELNSFQHTKEETTLNLTYAIEYPDYTGTIG